VRPIRSPGPTPRKEPGDDRLGDANEPKELYEEDGLIWLDRVVFDLSRRRTPSADRAAYAFSTNLQCQEAYPPQNGGP
jgi:hypothetical protein